ncbi:protein-disulfide reductase DsbD family protein [Candidatus Dependentiae bacterium]
MKKWITLLSLIGGLFVLSQRHYARTPESKETTLEVVKKVAATPVHKAARVVKPGTQASKVRAKKKEIRTINRIFRSAFSTESSMAYLLLMAFLAGILVSLTPCIYPMIPITASVLSSTGDGGVASHILRSVTYVLGIASIYSSLGYVSATTSVMFGQWMGNPWVVGALVLFFLYLAFSMLGFYEIGSFGISKSLGTGGSKKRSLFSVFLFGIFSGTAASPCLSPPLAMLLGLVAKIGSPFFGFLTLFSFALGLGIILIIVGTFSGSLTVLPAPGSWMEDIKRIFGFLMLFACAYFVSPFFPIYLSHLLYTLLFLAVATFYFSSSRNESILSVLQIHKEAEGSEVEKLKTTFSALPVRVILKKLAAMILFVFAIYYLGLAYLRFMNTTALNVLIKLLR